MLAFSLILFMGGPAIGGDYHSGATLLCSDCHVMHFSQTHGYNPNGGGFTTGLGSAGPYGYLLRNDVNDLCLTCHDGSAFAPDVLELPTGAPLVRQAGALNRGGTAPYFTATGHTLDATDTPPGGTWTPDPVHGLVCTDCHQPHGYGGPLGTNAYRNLNPFPGTAGFLDPPDYTDGPAPRVNDLTKDVFVRTALDYDIGQVDFNEPDPAASQYAAFCGGCHTDFHGAVGSAQIGGSGAPPEHFDRHPVAGVDIGAVGGGHSSPDVFAYGPTEVPGTKINWVKVMTATENWTPNDPVDVTDHTPSCMTCHKAHGNQNAFGLIYMNADSGAKTEQGVAGGVYKDLCQQCHVQG
jgi:hypothetical protein